MVPGKAIRKGSEGEEEMEEYHSFSGASGDEPQEDGEDDLESDALEAPAHPVKSMQGAFEESIDESIEDSESTASTVNPSAEARRQTLLEAPKYDDSWTARWSQRPVAKHHPLVKLISQIVFGMHLLQQQQAKSEGEVVKILQTHVNDVDSFLERTAEDFDLATSDIEERIRHLKLPMEHKEVFEIMLDDEKFRTQLLDGNSKIESIIERTTKAMNASIFDIEKGAEANKELGRYLDNVQNRWPNNKRIIAGVFGAMRGNEQGWTKYMKDLQIKGTKLRQHLVMLATVLTDMSRLAAGASQRGKIQSDAPPSKSAPSSPHLQSKFSDANAPPIPSPPRSSSNPMLQDSYTPSKTSSPPRSLSSLNKPLPTAPEFAVGVPQDFIPPRPVPFGDRSRQLSQLSQSTTPSTTYSTPQSTTTTNHVQRPKTAGGRSSKQARAADARNDTADLTDFLRATCGLQTNPPRRDSHQNPLRSNPTDEGRGLLNKNSAAGTPTGGPTRSVSQGAIDIVAPAEISREQVHPPIQPPAVPRASIDHMPVERPSFDRISSLAGTGFARRLSKRMKHLAVPEDAVVEYHHSEPSPDSAYASGGSVDVDADQKPRPESVLAPLPTKFMQPLYTSRVDTAEERKMSMSRDGQSVMSLAPTAKSKPASVVKSLFGRRGLGKRIFGS